MSSLLHIDPDKPLVLAGTIKTKKLVIYLDGHESIEIRDKDYNPLITLRLEETPDNGRLVVERESMRQGFSVHFT